MSIPWLSDYIRSLSSLSLSSVSGFGYFHRLALIFSSKWMFYQSDSFLGPELSRKVYFNISEPHCLSLAWLVYSSAPLISPGFWSSAFFGKFSNLPLAASLILGWMIYLVESTGASRYWNKDCDTVLPWTWRLAHIAVPLETSTEARFVFQMLTSPWCSALV